MEKESENPPQEVADPPSNMAEANLEQSRGAKSCVSTLSRERQTAEDSKI